MSTLFLACQDSPQIMISPKTTAQSDRRLRIFLCHAAGDKLAIRDLYSRLKVDGFAPWLDEEEILPGQSWEEEIRTAIRDCDIVLVCLSQKSVNKEGYVQKEIREALSVADEKPEGAIFIIPTLLEPIDVPKRLSQWQWANLFRKDGYECLTRALSLYAKKIGVTVNLTLDAATPDLQVGGKTAWSHGRYEAGHCRHEDPGPHESAARAESSEGLNNLKLVDDKGEIAVGNLATLRLAPTLPRQKSAWNGLYGRARSLLFNDHSRLSSSELANAALASGLYRSVSLWDQLATRISVQLFAGYQHTCQSFGKSGNLTASDLFDHIRNRLIVDSVLERSRFENEQHFETRLQMYLREIAILS